MGHLSVGMGEKRSSLSEKIGIKKKKEKMNDKPSPKKEYEVINFDESSDERHKFRKFFCCFYDNL